MILLYSYADALRYVLTERKKDLITLEEDLRQAKQNELIGYAKVNMWIEVNNYIENSIVVPNTEIDDEVSKITTEWVWKNQNLQEICSKKIEIYKRQIRWLEGQISYHDKQDLKSKEQRDKEDQERLNYYLNQERVALGYEDMDKIKELLNK